MNCKKRGGEEEGNLTIVAIAAAGIGAVILAVELKSVKSEYGVYLVMAAGVYLSLWAWEDAGDPGYPGADPGQHSDQ